MNQIHTGWTVQDSQSFSSSVLGQCSRTMIWFFHGRTVKSPQLASTGQTQSSWACFIYWRQDGKKKKRWSWLQSKSSRASSIKHSFLHTAQMYLNQGIIKVYVNETKNLTKHLMPTFSTWKVLILCARDTFHSVAKKHYRFTPSPTHKREIFNLKDMPQGQLNIQ